MRIRNLETFVKVARLGSFHAASEQLNTSQPAVSARINALEDELDVKLFDRDKGGTRLTPRGRQTLPYAEKLLALCQEMKQQLRQDTPEQGVLRIGISDTLASLWLAQLLRQWGERFPLVEFEISVDVSAVLNRQLREYQLDLTLTVAEEGCDQLISEPLCRYPMRWFAASSLVGTDDSSVPLGSHPVLSFPRQTRPWQYLQQLFAPLGEQRPQLHTCSSVASLLELAEQGVGIALLPEPLVQRGIDAGRLRQVEIDSQPPALEFSCNWHLNDDRLLPRLLADCAREITNN
ncbi:LysR family transcriptional regulator [Motiliproteus coralliicola]|uniref:LysR family transcriptional regulator n=1 Tax=Motiliproteus coralliicola TaxID=2283196 RepID=A0A369WLL5_9GAMM|nr:LysR family transcriptional regulator [Motiliproteus coralliicola]RDE22557.1 LysR family transcriptional regulator [Motiliproteus coralliicola]